MNLSTFVRDGVLKRKRHSLKERKSKKKRITYSIVKSTEEKCVSDQEATAKVLHNNPTKSNKVVHMATVQSDSEVS